LRDFPNLDEAIEWAEDQVIFRYGGFSNLVEVTLGEQELLAGLSHDEIAELAKNCETRIYRPGERIIARDDPSDSVFFLEQGMVSVKLADGVRLATLVPGMAFGELALIAFGRRLMCGQTMRFDVNASRSMCSTNSATAIRRRPNASSEILHRFSHSALVRPTRRSVC
jgi:hypothetical protein